MDPLDLFKPNTSFKRVYMEPRTSQKYVPTNMEAIDRELEAIHPQIVQENKEYVEEYVRAEERRVLDVIYFLFSLFTYEIIIKFFFDQFYQHFLKIIEFY